MTKVNKKEFINILSKKTKLSTEMWNHKQYFRKTFLTRKEKQIINDIEKELEVSRISSEEIKNKIKHPFKNFWKFRFYFRKLFI